MQLQRCEEARAAMINRIKREAGKDFPFSCGASAATSERLLLAEWRWERKVVSLDQPFIYHSACHRADQQHYSTLWLTPKVKICQPLQRGACLIFPLALAPAYTAQRRFFLRPLPNRPGEQTFNLATRRRCKQKRAMRRSQILLVHHTKNQSTFLKHKPIFQPKFTVFCCFLFIAWNMFESPKCCFFLLRLSDCLYIS